MGQCSGKFGSHSSHDLLSNTAWVREVVTGHQKKRRGISKFCNFSFEHVGESSDGGEECHKITVQFLNSKSQPQSVNWMVIHGPSSPHSPLSSEIKTRRTFLPDLITFLSSCQYKRAKYLVNIPELIYHEEKMTGQGSSTQYLVIENIQVTKKCDPCPPYLVQAGLDLTHLNLVLSTLAQYHAVSIAWKQSLGDDSILDIYPHLSRPPCSNISTQRCKDLLALYHKVLLKKHNQSLPERLEKKLRYVESISDCLSEPSEDDMNSVLGTVGLGAVTPLHIAFQVINIKSGSNLHVNSLLSQITDDQACAAISRVPNISFTTITRDLAAWVFTLANTSVKKYYLLEILHNYATTLTNALDLLGVHHEQFGVTFHQFCKHFFKEAELGVLVSILVSMNDSSEEDINEYLNKNEDDTDCDTTEANPVKTKRISVPLSDHRLNYLEHLLDDIYCFLTYECRTRDYEVLC